MFTKDEFEQTKKAEKQKWNARLNTAVLTKGWNCEHQTDLMHERGLEIPLSI